MATTPTATQQKGFAYAPIPFAILSILASSFVIHHILRRDPQKLQRLYHRLVLAGNVALIPLSFTYAWSTMAVPEGTPDYVGAMGTVNTCTAQGFMCVVFGMAAATYYGSLGLQAFLGIKHNFKEENYVWIEKWVHFAAYFLPLVLATIIAATENFNPNGSGCAVSKAPRGCEADPDVPCERGGDIDMVIYIIGFSQVFLYLILPPSGVLAVYFWIKRQHRKTTKNTRYSSGMSIVRESVRRRMMQSVYRQISVYLFSFWITFVFTLLCFVYQTMTGMIMYNLNIFANCIFALQGFIIAIVYFALQRMGKNPRVECCLQSTGVSPAPSVKRELTVSDIRCNAKRKTENKGGLQETAAAAGNKDLGETLNFNIFDGTPDQDSPWAKFIDQDSVCSSDEDSPGDFEQKMKV